MKSFFRNPAVTVVLGALALLLVSAAILAGHSYSRLVTMENISLPSGKGETLRVRRLKPASFSPRRGVVVAHGMSSCKEFMDPLSLELARAGYLVVVPDFPGDDIKKNIAIIVVCIDYLSSITGKNNVALAGHSLGAVEGVDTALFERQVKGVVAIGLYIGGDLALNPGNLLLITGLYDSFQTPGEMCQAISAFTDGAVGEPGITWGDFSRRTAKKLEISPFSQHSSEILDPHLVRETLSWLDSSFLGAPRALSPFYFTWHFTASALAFLSLFLLLLFIPLALEGDAPWDCRRRRARMVIYFLAGAGVWVLSFKGVLGGAWALGGCLLAGSAFAVLEVLYKATASPHEGAAALWRWLCRKGLGIAILCLSLFLSVALFEYRRVFLSAGTLAAFPFFFYFSFIEYPLVTIQAAAHRAAAECPPLLYGLGAFNILVMVLFATRASSVYDIVTIWLPRVLRIRRHDGNSRVKALILAALLVALFIIAGRTLNEPFASFSIIKIFLVDIVKYVALPIALSVGILSLIMKNRGAQVMK
ncbi:MAG: hypothetical protein RDV48_18520 [Candidatus Eremiobacteraeota bacterium]|nr:hypothetical protein [Candidatus Eremiobacteraeota bacterium]